MSIWAHNLSEMQLFRVSATPPSIRVSYSNPAWSERGQVVEREDGRKTGDVGERDRVEVFCGKSGNMWDMTLG